MLGGAIRRRQVRDGTETYQIVVLEVDVQEAGWELVDGARATDRQAVHRSHLREDQLSWRSVLVLTGTERGTKRGGTTVDIPFL